ncbi:MULTISPECIES: hypothetical protein [Gordonia]|uniref:hypothetical protein n=1 Tax=Gordonia TaxID=2053 RepID=UPI00128EDD61|nr:MULTISPECIES: hypothetical protein [Gordonia]
MSMNRIVIAAVGIALVVGAVIFNSKRRTVDATTMEIQDAMSGLDPVSRAAVIARLAADKKAQWDDKTKLDEETQLDEK